MEVISGQYFNYSKNTSLNKKSKYSAYVYIYIFTVQEKSQFLL